MRVGSLFSGIGGFDLAARWMGWSTAWFSEIEPYASKVLEKHWPGVPNHGDITKINGREVEYVDVLCGGFPCQDISLAGPGGGLDGERSGLWFHYARLIEEIRPRYIVAENVSALRSRGLDRVLGSLAALGYDAEWHCIPAAHVGAPHRRDRIWIVAYSNRVSRRPGTGEVFAPRNHWTEAGYCGSDVAHANGSGLQGLWEERPVEVWSATDGHTGSSSLGAVRPHEWWDVEPNVGRVANGIPKRVDRLKCLGNAIVPQVALLVFQAIQKREEALRGLSLL